LQDEAARAEGAPYVPRHVDDDLAAALGAPVLPTPAELRQAELRYPAENFARKVGIGEHLTATPELLRDYERREQEEPLAWALVRAAADWRRVGMNKPMPLPDLLAVASAHVRSKGIDAATPAEQEAARAWASRPHPRSRVALLTRIADDGREYVTALDQVAELEDRPGRVADPDGGLAGGHSPGWPGGHLWPSPRGDKARRQPGEAAGRGRWRAGLRAGGADRRAGTGAGQPHPRDRSRQR
jgi:hypothetical protein